MDVKYERGLTRKAIALSFTTTFLKFVGGIISNSSALISDALHGLIDFIEFIAIYFSLLLSFRKPDEKFPYGYYKIENFTSFLLSLLVLYLAYDLLKESAFSLYDIITGKPIAKEVSFGNVLIVSLISIIITFLIARILSKSRLESVKIVALEKKVDYMISIGVIISNFLTYLKIYFVEPLFVIFIVIILLKEIFPSLINSLFALLDVSPKKEIIDNILKKMKEGGITVKNYKFRVSGPTIFGDIFFLVPSRKSIEKYMKRVEELKSYFETKMIFLNFIPVLEKKDVITVAIPYEDGRISNHFARCPHILIITLDKRNGKIIEKKIVENKSRFLEKKRGVSLATLLIKNDVDALITREIGPGGFFTLSNVNIAVYRAEGFDIDENIKLLLENKLERLEKPVEK